MGKSGKNAVKPGPLRRALKDVARLVRVYRGDLSSLPTLSASATHDVLGPDLDAPRGLMVVLGAQVRPGGAPSRTLAARARHAGAAYAPDTPDTEHSETAGLIIASGGVGEAPPSEAEVMAGILVECGVPESRILREAASHSTRQSAHYVVALVRELGADEIVVVTDPLHCVRAVSAFRNEGLRAYAEPVMGSPMWRESRERRAQFIRELGAVAWYAARRPSH